MKETSVLFVKPGAIRPQDKRELRRAGIIVVEVEKPEDAKFVRAHAELTGGALLRCAVKAIRTSGTAEAKFAQAICAAIELEVERSDKTEETA